MATDLSNPSLQDRSSLQRAFGARLKALRKGRGLSQEELAHRIGMSVDLISGMERGIAFGSFDTLVKLATELACPLSALFEIEADQNPTLARINEFLAGQPQPVLSAAEAQIRALVQLSDTLASKP